MMKRPARKVFFRFLCTVVFYRKLRGEVMFGWTTRSSWRGGRGGGVGPGGGGAGGVMPAPPAAHAVADAASFRSALRKGFRLARRTGRFVTLGISPAHPATGDGYIERGGPSRGGGEGVCLVRGFAEAHALLT